MNTFLSFPHNDLNKSIQQVPFHVFSFSGFVFLPSIFLYIFEREGGRGGGACMSVGLD